MSLDLEAQIKSLRITEATLLWLRVEAAETGKSHNEIAREMLDQIAVAKRAEVHRKHRLYRAFSVSEGDSGETPGNS